MIAAVVELSGEARDLATGELAGAVVALGGSVGTAVGPQLWSVSLPAPASAEALAGRLALARRVLLEILGGTDLGTTARAEGGAGARASFRRLGSTGSSSDERVRELGREFAAGGGRIDLTRPDVRYWLGQLPDGRERLFRELATVDRKSFRDRAMPLLPFQRPVSLPPRLARAAVNVAAIRAGETVVDPFVGTGAMLAEAALLGARAFGVDADAAMIRGTLRNFEHFGLAPEALVGGDARSAEFPSGPERFDAIVTDPPYGRSSAVVGGSPSEVVAAALARWAGRLRPGGRVMVVGPGGADPLGPPWRESWRAEVRVHRSLTRVFRLYRRAS